MYGYYEKNRRSRSGKETAPGRRSSIAGEPSTSVNQSALEEAQAILVRCGAISYSVKELVERHAKARKLVSEISLADDALLFTLLDEVIAPVERLFSKVGGDLKALSSQL